MSAKGFDKNSIIGLVLIGAILLIFSIMSSPSEEELKAKKEEEKRKEKAKTEQVDKKENPVLTETATDTSSTTKIINNTTDSTTLIAGDSLKNLEMLMTYGGFLEATKGEEKEYIIENEKVKITISNKGGRVSSVELKEFHTYDSLPLMLFNADSSRFNIELSTNSIGGTKVINTENLFFETENSSFSVEQTNAKSFSMKLYYGGKDKYLEYKYTLSGNSYLVDFEINSVGFKEVIAPNFSYYLNWSMSTPDQEKTIDNQKQHSTIYYKYNTGDIDYIFETKYEKEEMVANMDWIMFKQQYFNATLIATETPFKSEYSEIETRDFPESPDNKYVQEMLANISIPFNGSDIESFKMQYYFGPNRHEDLAAVEKDLEESLDYGWGIFGWTNIILIRPVFDFLNSFGMSIGLIILLLTLIIKTLLFPITWKTYLSSAKMRVLKPEITELTEKHKGDAMKKQQATMALYRQTGVNPLAGCIPMLIQMPILFALFRFFPATFDLRQKSFLWAEDLSTYDSIYSWEQYIWGISDIYGNHISLFTLLMAISMIFYTRANSQMTAGAGMEGAMASQMKIMTYLMPVMMLFFFNSYAAGLSLYYLIANCITIAQQYVIKKWIVDEDKLRAKIQANKTKVKKKSGFAAKLEERMKNAQQMQQNRKKK